MTPDPDADPLTGSRPSNDDIVREIGMRRGVTITVDEQGLLVLNWDSPDDTVPIHRAALTDLVDRHNEAVSRD